MTVAQTQTPAQHRSIELSWDDFASGELPDTSHQQRLNDACVNAAQTMNQPPFNQPEDKLIKAMDLVLGNQVTLHQDGTFTVAGSKKAYEITDMCPCPQGQLGKTRYCKHLTAVVLWKRTQMELLGKGALNGQPPDGHQIDEEPEEEPVMETTQQPQAPAWPFQDPPYVHSLKWVDGDGIEHLEVIRAWTREEVNQRVIELKRLIRAARDAKPTPPAERPPAETNGQAHDAVDEPRCPIHGTAKLKPSKKHGGVYCSGKLDAGAWCQYKAKGGK